MRIGAGTATKVTLGIADVIVAMRAIGNTYTTELVRRVNDLVSCAIIMTNDSCQTIVAGRNRYCIPVSFASRVLYMPHTLAVQEC